MIKPSEALGPSPVAGLRGRRAVQAEQTRTEILGAARHQFVTNGYAATSMKEIAAAAGVSVQTVYDSVGSKAQLVRRLNDLIDVEAGLAEIAMALPAELDPLVVAVVPARITRRLIERCGDIVRASIDGARADPDLVDVAREGGRRHRLGARAVAQRLDTLNALEPPMSLDDAAATIALLADARVALAMIDDHGFTLNDVETWIGTMTTRALLLDIRPTVTRPHAP